MKDKDEQKRLLIETMREDENGLKPCPFCGGQAEIKQTGKLQITVRCKSCLMGLTQKVFRYSLDWLRVKMKENWNQRIYQHESK